jgi:hypothetical protein
MKNKPEAPETRKVYADGRPSIPDSTKYTTEGIGAFEIIVLLAMLSMAVYAFVLFVIKIAA